MVFSKHQVFKLFLQILFVFAFSVSLFGCSGGGSSDAITTTDPTTTTTTDPTTTASTGDVIFTGTGTSALPSSVFNAVSFNEPFVNGNDGIMEWVSSDDILVSVVYTNNIVVQIGVATLANANVWIADASFVTINTTYDGTVVTFTDQTLFEGSGAAGDLVMNGSLSR